VSKKIIALFANLLAFLLLLLQIFVKIMGVWYAEPCSLVNVN